MIKTQSIVNPQDIQQLITQHELFRQIHNLYGPPPDWQRPPGFISLCQIILEQQVSLASAKAHFNKLSDYVGSFTPQTILALTDEEMRTCQISRQKSAYLRALSAAVVDKSLRLDRLTGQPEESIREQLTKIKGIGHWTTDIYLMFCLQSKDIFPIGDIAIVNTLRKLTSAETREQMIALSEEWKPLRSLGTYFLWHHYLSSRKSK